MKATIATMNRDGEVLDLLQQLIRNRCVNTNARESGQEHRSVAVLKTYLEGGGLDIRTYEAAPGRESLVARIEGSDPNAPSLVLMGHTDVVPANEQNWQHDPFGGELIDGYVWGRGAIDMLNLTASMAVAMRDLADAHFQPKGDLIYFAVADEESGGSLGAKWVAEHAWEDIRADYLITEWGGVPLDSPTGPKLWITVGQKGGIDLRLTIRGKSGHASMPFNSDNALVKAARIVSLIADYRIAPEISEVWRQQIEGMNYDADLTAALLDADRLDEGISRLSPGLAKRAHACTRLTAAPTVMQGGVKSNVIPDRVDISVLMRRLPNQTYEQALDVLRDMLGDLVDDVEITVRMNNEPSQSEPHTPLWKSLERVSAKLTPGAACIPSLTPGGNDAGVFRQRGTTAYGFGLLSNAISIEDFFDMFHGDDERIDLESLRLSRELWTEIARDFVG